VIAHPSVAGAAVLAGLIVAGGGYAARHDLGLGSGLQASALARTQLEHELTSGVPRRRAPHLMAWHPPRVPKIHVHPRPAPVVVAAAPVVTTVAPAPVVAAAPVATSAPVTRTSPVGGDDGGGDD
jgi:hypothetical protein